MLHIFVLYAQGFGSETGAMLHVFNICTWPRQQEEKHSTFSSEISNFYSGKKNYILHGHALIMISKQEYYLRLTGCQSQLQIHKLVQ